MSITRRSLEIQDIQLDRYYPPTDSRLNQIALDYEYLRNHSDAQFKQDCLNELGRVTLRAGNMLKDGSQGQNAYIDFSARAFDLAKEV